MEALFLRVIFLLLCSLFNMRLAFLLFQKGREKKSAFYLALVALFSGIYCFTNAITDLSWRGPFSYETQLFWTRATWIGIMAVASYLVFLYYFTDSKKHIKLKIFLCFAPTILIFLIAIFTPLLIESLELKSNTIKINPGILDSLGRGYMMTLILLGIVYLLRAYFDSKGFKRLQIKYLVVGFVIYALGGLIFAGILPLATGRTDPYVDISAFLSSLWVGLTSYAIVRYQLMNIRLALGKTVSFLLSFITLAGGIFLLISVYYPAPNPPNFTQVLPLALLLALIVFELNKFYESLTEIFFYPGFFKRKLLVSNLEENLGYLLEMERFSSLLTETLKEAFETEKVAVFTKNLTQNEFNLQKNVGFKEKKIKNLIEDNSFVSTVKRNKEPFIVQDISRLLKTSRDNQNKKKLKNKLKELRVGVVAPLLFEKRIIGIILLGEKSASEAFSREDFKILSSLSHQASVALRNTLLYSEIKKRKEELERFYKLTVEKEIKIIRLKKKLSKLEQKIEKEG